MRNVVKGYQFQKLAVPKMHSPAEERGLNRGFSSLHAPRMPAHPPKAEVAKVAHRPGKNAGIRGGT